jgi:hypothetical protein
LDSRLSTYNAGALPLEPHLQSILLWLIWRWDLMNYLYGLTSNQDPPSLQVARITGVSHKNQAISHY